MILDDKSQIVVSVSRAIHISNARKHENVCVSCAQSNCDNKINVSVVCLNKSGMNSSNYFIYGLLLIIFASALEIGAGTIASITREKFNARRRAHINQRRGKCVCVV